ncbi:transcription factor TGA4-like [Rutidosis leptorrhynchoides]|uniref:transcription factor TGA4-like n=1 Tax=Rutidosis leptorrhynchoides TaxID=125765 RepID=UPI003A9A043D
MTTTSTHFATSRRMGIYDPLQQISMWDVDPFGGNLSPNLSHDIMTPEVDESLATKTEYNSQESFGATPDTRTTKTISDKLQRRLAQNREAARKSRLRKKAYVQQLETGRMKLAQLEQELERARHQGVYGLSAGNSLLSGNVINSGIATFEMEYELWVAEQQKKDCELRQLLLTPTTEIELRIFVESGFNHYFELFRLKAEAAKADVFYLMNGMWKTPVERFFQWIGGFRPSELLYILIPQIELNDTQLMKVRRLRQSCEQAEEAVTQGLEKLQQNLAQSITIDITGVGSYNSQMNCAIERLEALEIFLNQADHLRKLSLQQMYPILTLPQAAKALLVLGEYFQHLRVLSSIWSTRPRDPTTLLS